MWLPRCFLAVSSVLLFGGAAIHALAYRRFNAALATAGLPPFYASSARGLWLIDSATQAILACSFVLICVRPSIATPWSIAMLAAIPAATAVLIYVFLGNFPAGHVLAAAAAAGWAAAWLLAAAGANHHA